MTDGSDTEAHRMPTAWTAWLLVLTALLIATDVHLAHLMMQVKHSAPQASISRLETRIAALEHAQKAAAQRPASLSASAFSAAQTAIDDRLKRLEASTANQASNSEMSALRLQLEALTRKVSKALAPQHRPARQPIKLVDSEPAFALVGIELRGTQPFVTLLPTGATSLIQVQVLRIGEAYDGWTVESIEEHAVQIRNGDRLRKLRLP